MQECNGYTVEYIVILSVIIRIMFSLICCHFILIIIVHVIVYNHIMSKKYHFVLMLFVNCSKINNVFIFILSYLNPV